MSAGNFAGLIKLHQRIDEHFSVYPEVFDWRVDEQFADRVGHRADADLQAGTVLDFLRNESGHLLLDLPSWRMRKFGQCPSPSLDHIVDLIDMNTVLHAIDVGHAFVGFDNDDSSFLGE